MQDDLFCDLLLFFATSSERDALRASAKARSVPFQKKSHPKLGRFLRMDGIGDAGLAELSGLPKLEMLWLNGTRTTIAGLSRLRETASLRRLFLNAKPKDGARNDGLQQMLPQVRIIR